MCVAAILPRQVVLWMRKLVFRIIPAGMNFTTTGLP